MQCYEYLYPNTSDRNFECCSTITYEENQSIQEQEVSFKYINLKFYARIFAQEITANDLLKIYFSFEKWDDYALYNEDSNIVFDYSTGPPKGFSKELDLLVHKARYTIFSTPILGQAIPYTIEENSHYVKRIPPAKGALASYDFTLAENSTAEGLLDKRGYVHVAEDGGGSLLLFSNFYIGPRPIAWILPGVAITSMNSAFEDLLKGMLRVDYGCRNFIKENTSN